MVAHSVSSSARTSARGRGGSGDFLDPFVYLGCANSEDIDLCVEGYGCCIDPTEGNALQTADLVNARVEEKNIDSGKGGLDDVLFASRTSPPLNSMNSNVD